MISRDYQNRFSGVERLLGRDALARLHGAHVCVVGTGGVGSWAAEGLARSGAGSLTLVDFDVVCLANVNRQLPAIEGEFGLPKVDALARRLRLINPGIRVTTRAERFTAATAGRLLATRFDCVIDAIDSVPDKALLIAECARRGLACVTAGGAGGKREPGLVRTGDLGESVSDVLLRLVRKKLRRDHGFARGEGRRYGVRCVYSTEKSFSSRACETRAAAGSEQEGNGPRSDDGARAFGTAVFVTGAFGFAAAGEAVRIIARI